MTTNLCWCPQCNATWTGFRLAEHEGVDRDDDGRVMITCIYCWVRGFKRDMVMTRSRLVAADVTALRAGRG